MKTLSKVYYDVCLTFFKHTFDYSEEKTIELFILQNNSFTKILSFKLFIKANTVEEIKILLPEYYILDKKFKILPLN